MLNKLKYTLNFIIIILIFCICSCGNKLLYIENDNRFKFHDLYQNNIKTSSGNLKLIAIFNDAASLNIAKEHINLFKPSYLNKFDILVILIYSYQQNNSILFNNYFDSIKDFYLFLKTNKNFTNNFYTLGIPQSNTDSYDVLIFLKKKK